MTDERPASTEEAAEIVRNDPALSVATDEVDNDDREPDDTAPTGDDD